MTIFEFRNEDFVPLAGFGRRWRFTEERYNVLPAAALARIRPLLPSIARDLLPRAIEMCRDPGAQALRIDASPDDDVVRQELAKLPIPPPVEIVVHWDGEDAVVTDWQIFLQYWSDFCYPASDDVTIWPMSGAWLLCYCHEEEFAFVSRAVAA